MNDERSIYNFLFKGGADDSAPEVNSLLSCPPHNRLPGCATAYHRVPAETARHGPHRSHLLLVVHAYHTRHTIYTTHREHQPAWESRFSLVVRLFCGLGFGATSVGLWWVGWECGQKVKNRKF